MAKSTTIALEDLVQDALLMDGPTASHTGNRARTQNARNIVAEAAKRGRKAGKASKATVIRPELGPKEFELGEDLKPLEQVIKTLRQYFLGKNPLEIRGHRRVLDKTLPNGTTDERVNLLQVPGEETILDEMGWGEDTVEDLFEEGIGYLLETKPITSGAVTMPLVQKERLEDILKELAQRTKKD